MFCGLTLNLLTTTIVAPPSNASKWQMGFNSAFKGLNIVVTSLRSSECPTTETRGLVSGLLFTFRSVSIKERICYYVFNYVITTRPQK